MYLSRIRLNPTRRGTAKLLSSPQAMHAVVAGSHPGLVAGGAAGSDDPDGRVLWRLDRGASHDLQLYVVSPEMPDFHGLVEQAGWPSAIDSPSVRPWDVTDYDGFLARVAIGQQWHFRVTLNPVRNVPQGQGRRGKVLPCISVRSQTAWFLDRTQRWGFTPATDASGEPAVAVVERGLEAFGRHRPAGEGSASARSRDRVSITHATFTGTLQVTDADTLRSSLCHGMGRAKAYGCGLMTLLPVRS